MDVYLTNTNGNEGDILGLVRSAHLYYPDCIKTPISEKETPFLNLIKLHR